MDELLKEWMEYADRDYGVAKHLYENYHPKPLEIICFHCQQAAEKSIKAVIILKIGEEAPKIHDLSALLRQIADHVQIKPEFPEYADSLTPYSVVLRYPNELCIDERGTMSALEMAKEILDWAHSIIDDTKVDSDEA